MQHELHPRTRVLQVHEQVPGLLEGPCLDRVACDAEDPYTAGAMLDRGKNEDLIGLDRLYYGS
jgi:hypothetical protein